MDFLLIAVSVLAFSANSLMTRTFQTKVQKSKHSINLYQALLTLIGGLAYFIMSAVSGASFSVHILLPAVLFGACFALTSLCSAKCMAIGYMSLTSVIVNLSLILPVAFSWIVLKETVEATAVIGLGLIIITLVLSSLSAAGKGKGDENGGNLKKWLPLVMIAFLCNGSTAIMQKQYKADYGESDLSLYMGASYLVASAIFFTVYLVRNSKSGEKLCEQVKSPRVLPLLPTFALVSGLGSFVGNAILGYLCDRVSGGILYPCINGGLCILVSLLSFIIFKERLSKRKIAAICVGVAAIVLLNL